MVKKRSDDDDEDGFLYEHTELILLLMNEFTSTCFTVCENTIKNVFYTSELHLLVGH